MRKMAKEKNTSRGEQRAEADLSFHPQLFTASLKVKD